MTLQETIDKIRPIDRKAAALAQKGGTASESPFIHWGKWKLWLCKSLELPDPPV